MGKEFPCGIYCIYLEVQTVFWQKALSSCLFLVHLVSLLQSQPCLSRRYCTIFMSSMWWFYIFCEINQFSHELTCWMMLGVRLPAFVICFDGITIKLTTWKNCWRSFSGVSISFHMSNSALPKWWSCNKQTTSIFTTKGWTGRLANEKRVNVWFLARGKLF